MPQETESSIFHAPTKELLIDYATHLRSAIDNPTEDGSHLVRTPSGQFRDTTIGIYRGAASVCEELIALGEQAVVDKLFPQGKILREDQVVHQDLSPETPVSPDIEYQDDRSSS